jgi:hypothetical protein
MNVAIKKGEVIINDAREKGKIFKGNWNVRCTVKRIG